MSKLTTNTTNLQSILEKINNLPEAGTDLPELTNPALAEEIFLNKEAIDADGNIRTGTFTIDSELNEQDDLLTQITSALEGKASGVSLPTLTTPATESEVFEGSEYINQSGNKKTGTFTINQELSAQDELIAQIQNAVNNLPEAGGGGTENNTIIIADIIFEGGAGIIYLAPNKTFQTINTNSYGVEVLNGFLYSLDAQYGYTYTGECVYRYNYGTYMWVLLSNGTLTIKAVSGGTN